MKAGKPTKPPVKLNHPGQRFTRAEGGPYCGAKRNAHTAPPGSRCKQPAGCRTDHPGQGRCWKHGGRSTVNTNAKRVGPAATGRYSSIEHHKLRDLTARVQAEETDVMDLAEEVHLLRALLIQYINDYEEFVEALMAWYAEKDVKQKPRRIMDISDVSHMIESVSRVVERLHKIRSEGSVSLETFRRITEQMGLIVARIVPDPTVLNAIEAEWGSLAMDAKKTALPPLKDVQAEEEDNE